VQIKQQKERKKWQTISEAEWREIKRKKRSNYKKKEANEKRNH
jgi:hypothetical protein